MFRERVNVPLPNEDENPRRSRDSQPEVEPLDPVRHVSSQAARIAWSASSKGYRGPLNIGFQTVVTSGRECPKVPRMSGRPHLNESLKQEASSVCRCAAAWWRPES